MMKLFYARVFVLPPVRGGLSALTKMNVVYVLTQGWAEVRRYRKRQIYRRLTTVVSRIINILN